MSHVYLVVGETGEYDDHSDWIVCAFKTKEGATARLGAIEARIAELGLTRRTWRGEHWWHTEAYEVDPWHVVEQLQADGLDPWAKFCAVPGLRYSVAEIELQD